jgi:hypothetical protein
LVGQYGRSKVCELPVWVLKAGVAEQVVLRLRQGHGRAAWHKSQYEHNEQQRRQNV